jgi:site-specific recombinase XerD
MRTAVAAMRAYYGLHLGRDWKLFDLVRSPSAQKLPTVLTRAEVARLFATVREPRFRTLFRLIYACGLRIGEAVTLEVRDLREPGRVHLREAKGNKERYVPLPPTMLQELRAFWKTHRHPRWIFPGVGRGWREKPEQVERLGRAVEPLGVGSVQHCLRLARAQAQLPAGTVVHTLRHSYATHLLEEKTDVRLIQVLLGHARVDTTALYAQVATNVIRAVMSPLDRLKPLTPENKPPA